MKHLIDSYLEAHEGAWAETTRKSETSRLRSVAHLIDQGPEVVIAGTDLKPYALKTLMIRLVHFEKWAKSGTRYADYMQKHKNRFKHTYVKEEINVEYEDAISKIEGMAGEYREHARLLLTTGLRFAESLSLRDGRVIGKGGKHRKIYGAGVDGGIPFVSKSALRRALSRAGLKPHTLRKLAATRCAERGATPADLCKIFGWSDIRTAYAYLQPKDDKRLEELMK